jgi:hypothetical protein
VRVGSNPINVVVVDLLVQHLLDCCNPIPAHEIVQVEDPSIRVVMVREAMI